MWVQVPSLAPPLNQLNRRARVVELADSLDSGSSAHYGRAGSSPASRTKKERHASRVFLFCYPGRKRRELVVQPTRLQKYERPRDGFLARRVRAAARSARLTRLAHQKVSIQMGRYFFCLADGVHARATTRSTRLAQWIIVLFAMEKFMMMRYNQFVKLEFDEVI